MVLPLLARIAGRAIIGSGAPDAAPILKNLPMPELEVSVTGNVKEVISSLNNLAALSEELECKARKIKPEVKESKKIVSGGWKASS